MLRAVAVVDVPINDQDPLEPGALPEPVGGDRHVVEQTEAHGEVALGVMPRGASRGKAPVETTLGHLAGERDDRPRGEPRDPRAFGADRGIHRVEHRGSARDGLLDVLDVGGVVNPPQPVVLRFHGSDPHATRREPAVLESIVDADQTLGALRVPGPRVVLPESWIVDQTDVAHGSNSSVILSVVAVRAGHSRF